MDAFTIVNGSFIDDPLIIFKEMGMMLNVQCFFCSKSERM